MSLQKRTLNEFRLAYPQKSLRETSELTGIQLTRIFRLLNGSPMKVDEYEKFKTAIARSFRASSPVRSLEMLFTKAIETLPERELEKIRSQIHHLVHMNTLINGDMNGNTSEQNIA